MTLYDSVIYIHMSVCKHFMYGMYGECKNPGGIRDVGRKAACGPQFWRTSCRHAMRCSAKVVRLPYDYFSPNIARWNAENMVTWKKLRLWDFETHFWHFGAWNQWFLFVDFIALFCFQAELTGERVSTRRTSKSRPPNIHSMWQDVADLDL